MTTLASWAGIDSRGAASLYLVSDSRFTNSATGKIHTDTGQKVYVCAEQPHAFGFCGSVNFPSKAIEVLVQEIDAGRVFTPKDDLDTRHERVAAFFAKRLEDVLRTPQGKFVSSFNILHAGRQSVGLKSTFRLWRLSWSPFDSWQIRDIPMPTCSKLLYEDGSGATALRIEHDTWQSSDVSETSRAIFSAFCDALRAGRDKFSGGAPQLVGLFRKFAGQYFGIVFANQTYSKGKPVAGDPIPKPMDWFNEAFERVDPLTGKRLEYAQRQPRPWSSQTTKRYLP
jgi:hypothetical protein